MKLYYVYFYNDEAIYLAIYNRMSMGMEYIYSSTQSYDCGFTTGSYLTPGTIISSLECRDFSVAPVFIKINEGSLCRQLDHKKLILPTFLLDAIILLKASNRNVDKISFL